MGKPHLIHHVVIPHRFVVEVMKCSDIGQDHTIVGYAIKDFGENRVANPQSVDSMWLK